MRRIIFIAMPILMIGMASCSFIRTVPKIKESELPKSCEGLVPLIKKKWKKNREQDYYRYDKEFLDKLQNEYKDCVLQLSVEEAIKLFGDTPVKVFGNPYSVWGKHFLLYYLKPGCIGYPQDCEILSFRIEDEEIKEFSVRLLEFVEEGN